MGQEQSIPQDEINNVNKLDNNEKNDNKQNEKDDNNKNSTINSNILIDTKSMPEKDTIKDNNYQSPKSSLQSLLKSYKSSKFFSNNIIDCLTNISSPISYPENHEIWNNLLKKEKIPSVNTRQGSFDMNVIVNFIGKEISENNSTSKNFSTLISILLSNLNSLKTNNYKTEINVETRNALYIMRLLSKYFIENLSTEEIKKLFNDNDTLSNKAEISSNDNNDNNNINQTIISNNEINESDKKFNDKNTKENENIEIYDEKENIKENKSNLEILVEELLNILIYLPQTSENNIEFYDEVLNTLIVYSASRYKNDVHNSENYILIIIFKILSEKEDNKNLAGKIITKLLLNLMYSNDQKEGLFARVLKKSSLDLSPISKKSLYLFLLLTNQPNKLAKNELSNIVNELANSQELNDNINIANIDDLNLKIPFQNLYTLIYEKIYENEEIVLLLYQLISQNEAFRSFTLSKFDPELLLLPLLQSLYSSFKEKINFNKIYTIIITILIMSQDEIYTEILQRIEINHPSWFMDNNMKKISLSNFTLLILLKIIQINLGKYKDIYLHSNCLAILANLSIKMDNINYYAAQKLIGFLELFQKKYTKIKSLNEIELAEDENINDMEIKINEDLIMLLLGIINSCFINSLKTNLQLVYTVMRGKEVINNLKNIERFEEQIENILYVSI